MPRCSPDAYKQPADVMGIFPPEALFIRLVGAVLLRANNRYQLRHRYLGIEAVADILSPPQTYEPPQLSPKAASPVATSKPKAISATLTNVTYEIGVTSLACIEAHCANMIPSPIQGAVLDTNSGLSENSMTTSERARPPDSTLDQ